MDRAYQWGCTAQGRLWLIFDGFRGIVGGLMSASARKLQPAPASKRCVGPDRCHDVRLAGKLLSRLKSGSMLLADWIRELAMKKGAWANIAPKSNRSDPICFSPYLYRARNQVERFFNRTNN